MRLHRRNAGYTLIELSVAVGLMLLMGMAILGMLNSQFAISRMQVRAQAFTTDMPQIRNVLSRTAALASRVRVFSDATGARGTGNTAAASGTAVRIEYSGGQNTPSNAAWNATLEYRSANRQIVYRNQDGTEWVAITGIDSCSFSIVDGALRTTFTANGYTADCFTAIN